MWLELHKPKKTDFSFSRPWNLFFLLPIIIPFLSYWDLNYMLQYLISSHRFVLFCVLPLSPRPPPFVFIWIRSIDLSSKFTDPLVYLLLASPEWILYFLIFFFQFSIFCFILFYSFHIFEKNIPSLYACCLSFPVDSYSIFVRVVLKFLSDNYSIWAISVYTCISCLLPQPWATYFCFSVCLVV